MVIKMTIFKKLINRRVLKTTNSIIVFVDLRAWVHHSPPLAISGLELCINRTWRLRGAVKEDYRK